MANPLSRVAMQSILRERNPKMNFTRENKDLNLNNKKEVKLEEHVQRNFTNNEDCILKGIIRGETEVIEGKMNNTPITLEEAASRKKNNR